MARARLRRQRRQQNETLTQAPTAAQPTLEQYQQFYRAQHGGSLVGFQGEGAPPPMPGAEYDSEYNNDLAAAEAAYESTMARIGLGESRLSFDTGFGKDGQVDLSNPYSQAMMLQRFKQQAGRGINNSMAAGGHIYSGARQRAQDENNFQYERNRSNLQTAAQRGFQDFGLAGQDAANARANAGYGAAADQAERWRNARNDWYALYGS